MWLLSILCPEKRRSLSFSSPMETRTAWLSRWPNMTVCMQSRILAPASYSWPFTSCKSFSGFLRVASKTLANALTNTTSSSDKHCSGTHFFVFSSKGTSKCVSQSSSVWRTWSGMVKTMESRSTQSSRSWYPVSLPLCPFSLLFSMAITLSN